MTRRDLFGLGCAAAALVATWPAEARGVGHAGVAPRRTCPHAGCRHHRPGDHRPGDTSPGICALALRSPTVEEIQ